MILSNWYEQYREASLLKETWAKGLTPSELNKRLSYIGWTVEKKKNEYMAKAPNKIDKFTYAPHEKNWSFNIGNIRGHLLNISKDLAFIWENPFKIPENFNPMTMEIELEEEVREKCVYFKDLTKYLNTPIEVLHRNKWKHPEDIDFSNIMFSDGEVVEFSPNNIVTIRTK